MIEFTIMIKTVEVESPPLEKRALKKETHKWALSIFYEYKYHNNVTIADQYSINLFCSYNNTTQELP